MTPNTGESKCKYCWRPSSIEGHNEGCPLTYPIKERKGALDTWERGWVYGFHSWERDRLRWENSSTWNLGCRAGEAKIDGMAKEAADFNTKGYEY